MYRVSVNGRNMEYMGEDPYLAGKMAVSYIEGVQSKGVVATVKHFAANNSEYDRHQENSIVDERTLRELYLPAFEMAVKQAHVGAVMDSYNLLNNEHLTQNQHLNLDILKKEWGFDGILMSDWEATYDGVAAANAGLDLEMPSARFMSASTLTAAVHDGRIKMETIDDKVRRILRTAVRFDFFDRSQQDDSLSSMNPESDKTALDEALESAVLLRNEGGLLPLKLETQHNIVIVGPDAWPSHAGGGGSSLTAPFASDNIASAVSQYVGSKGRVIYIAGIPEQNDLYARTRFTNDLFEQTRFTEMVRTIPAATKENGSTRNAVKVSQIFDYRDGAADVSEGKNPDHAPTTFVWSGRYEARTEGKYYVVGLAPASASYTIRVNGEAVVSKRQASGTPIPGWGVVTLKAGEDARVEVETSMASDTPQMSVGLMPADHFFTSDDKKIIAAADAVVVALGMNGDYEGEGFDRPFQLPWGQEQLLDSVLQLNRRIVVDIQAGGAMDAHLWADRVPALIQSWYPGQSGGAAFAQILFGDHSPEGKLPMSWERTLEENPAYAHYYEEPGPDHKVAYAEGLNLGYRYYTTEHKQPLFPFGFGLSYTSFKLDGLHVTKVSGDDVVISLQVTNTGFQSGAEVVQVYVSDPSAIIKRPIEELKGFAKVRLTPGKTETVTLHLDRRAFSYYDTGGHAWRVDPGEFQILVGTSSVNLPLRQSIHFE